MTSTCNSCMSPVLLEQICSLRRVLPPYCQLSNHLNTSLVWVSSKWNRLVHICEKSISSCSVFNGRFILTCLFRVRLSTGAPVKNQVHTTFSKSFWFLKSESRLTISCYVFKFADCLLPNLSRSLRCLNPRSCTGIVQVYLTIEAFISNTYVIRLSTGTKH